MVPAQDNQVPEGPVALILAFKFRNPGANGPRLRIFGQRGTQRPTSVQGPGLYRALSCVGARAFVPCSVVHSTEVGVRIPYGPLVGGRLKWGETPSRKLLPGALKPVYTGGPLRAWSPKLPRIRCQMVFRYGELATPEPPLPHSTGRPAAACSAGGTNVGACDRFRPSQAAGTRSPAACAPC